MKRLSIPLLGILLIATACTSDDTGDTTTPPTSAAVTTTTAPARTSTAPPPTTTTSLPPVVVPTLEATSFGELAAVPLLAGGSYGGAAKPSGLSSVYIPDWVDNYLDTYDAKGLLDDNGFVVVPTFTRHFHHIYEGSTYDGWPVFFTTDAAYHVWHLAFDKILREAEQQSLLPVLESMLLRLVELARAQESELAGSDLAEAASRVTQFYEAAATVLELDVAPIGALAQEEVDLINAAAGIRLSPTTGGDPDSGYITTKIDYSLFRPRGHYTRNGDLERFFRAMSQLGNNAFLLDESLLLGVLASRVVIADPAVAEQWQLIYEPTAWLVGAADDYTPFELGAVVEEVVPTGWSDVTVFTDPDTLDGVAAGLLALRPVEINPEAASLRIMGSRFVIDSYILDQLVAPLVARDEASPLDIAAAFGSEWAAGVLTASGANDADGYDEQMSAMQSIISDRTIADWGATVYDAWLYAVSPMWQEHGADFPAFMQSDAWAAKAHQTGFGSYTELKHDTILYTKQAVAEGGGEEPPTPPRHWVEPDPVAYERLAAVSALMRDGLTSRELLPADYELLLDDLEEFYVWLAGIARDELAGVPISEEDNQELGWVGSTLEGFWIRTSDTDLDWENGPDSHAALIADVMRNAQAVLELGTGFVDYIFVTVPDDRGGFQVATGGVYSYYEFWNTGQRLTDEEWRAQLEAGTQPERPDWQQVFLAAEETQTETVRYNRTGLETGLFCRDLAGMGYGFTEAAAYWLAEGAPDRMDADRDGIPCETVFPEEYESFLNAAIGEGEGKLCRDLGFPDDGEGYLRAVAYWMLEGAPDRMDADQNGVPCETVFSAGAIDEFFMVYGP
ncbi:MAG: DUF3160 domain-containing protein [Acidimicrobiia bacterium]|nr:DUF3160 domain-containing protein [Acidimicrobiia bacterium]